MTRRIKGHSVFANLDFRAVCERALCGAFSVEVSPVQRIQIADAERDTVPNNLGMAARNRHIVQEDFGVRVPPGNRERNVQQEAGSDSGASANDKESASGWQRRYRRLFVGGGACLEVSEATGEVITEVFGGEPSVIVVAHRPPFVTILQDRRTCFATRICPNQLAQVADARHPINHATDGTENPADQLEWKGNVGPDRPQNDYGEREEEHEGSCFSDEGYARGVLDSQSAGEEHRQQQQVARNNRCDQGYRNHVADYQGEHARRNKQSIRNRVEIHPEAGDLVEPAGDQSVDEIARRSEKQNHQRPREVSRNEQPKKDGNGQKSKKRNRIGNRPDTVEPSASHAPILLGAMRQRLGGYARLFRGCVPSLAGRRYGDSMTNALIVVDAQQGFDEPLFGPRNNSGCEDNIRALLAHWRVTGQPVVLVRHDSLLPTSPLAPGQPGNDFKPGIDGPHNLLVTKNTNSAFYGKPDLHEWLSANGVTTVTICGITTDHCCSTTARMADNLGYAVDFVLDATHTHDRIDSAGHTITADEVARINGASLAGEFARVLTTAEVLGVTL